MDKNKARIFFIAAGLLDLFLFYRTYRIAGAIASSFHFTLSSTLELLLLCSLPVSGILLLLDKKAGLILYYFQFPLKLAFSFLTFGFILSFFPYTGMLHKIILGVVFGLETLRLVLTVTVPRKGA